MQAFYFCKFLLINNIQVPVRTLADNCKAGEAAYAVV